MLQQYPSSTDKNTRMNFDVIFTHINQYYLGSLSRDEIERLNMDELPCGALVYDRTNHVLAVLSCNAGTKVWKSVMFQ
jgi:hypothetical protein